MYVCMYTRKCFPLQGELAPPLTNWKRLLEKLDKVTEAKRIVLEATSTATSTGTFTTPARKPSVP